MKNNPWRLLSVGSGLLVALVLGFPIPAATRSIRTENPAAAQSSWADYSGEYDVTGTSASGVDYEGVLQISKHGSVYQLHWSAGTQYDGIGIVNGNSMVVSYTDADVDPEDCGAVSYRILPNGTLDGVWGLYGEDQTGTERAVRVRGTGLAGSYNFTGTNLVGDSYKGTLSIVPKGMGYEVQWSRDWSGFGIRQGNTLSVAYGGTQCYWVAYEIKPGGVLVGLWGGYGAASAGTERAVRR